MKIIKKIEIENFRGFLGTRKDDKAEISDITDLNIFSGANDSGKSNVLRALNLFFNGTIDTTHEFYFDNDFNVLKQNQTKKVIKIKLHFEVSKRKYSISKFWDRNGYRNFEYEFTEKGTEITIDSRSKNNEKRYGKDGKTPNLEILKKENGYRRAALKIISSISFSYIPAIREERFFSHLYGKIIYKIKKNEEIEIYNLQTEKRKLENYENKTKNNISEKKSFLEKYTKKSVRDERIKEIDTEINKNQKLGDSIKKLENEINSYSKNLFKSINFLNSEFQIGDNLLDFFENFNIATGENKNISLKLRGDGIQAKFIPEMLKFVDSISKEKYFIWGFEEPENSSEYKNQQELAKKLKNDFTNNKQIFLTTHSEEFLSMYDSAEIGKEQRKANLYHVKKESNNKYESFSVIKLFDVDNNTFGLTKSSLEEDLGTSLIRAKYSKELIKIESKFLEGKKQFEEKKENEMKKLRRELSETYPNKIFICEDEKGVAIWDKFFEEWEIKEIKVLSSRGCSNDSIEKWIDGQTQNKLKYKPRVFRSLDRDGWTEEQIKFLEEKLSEKNKKKSKVDFYKLKFLPVNEIENFAVISDVFFTKEEIKKNVKKNENIKESFLKTINSNLLQSKYKNEENKLFDHSKTIFIGDKMLCEAREDPMKFLPGKDIKILKKNFNVEQYFLGLLKDSYPKELEKYLKEIKDFFE